ncbi:hypothetical protein [Actinomycetospora sp. TBRC 11914]|uniref:hypothetical protein n=1 Tax=Actinomycetospora sp. TBRC 11914 TaxID=2729387 RepID=UPI00145DA15B|nr:hypothetical protein [Actinomycetospora sp. TBRC 11914]NMO92499.1 hypothetical protein [Actinomycetospora sp. TBRC 11914]
MTTPRHADEASPAEIGVPEALGVVIPVPAAPDREMLGRVLDGLRELPERPTARPPAAPAPDPTAAVPLPRRSRTERRAPSLE